MVARRRPAIPHASERRRKHAGVVATDEAGQAWRGVAPAADSRRPCPAHVHPAPAPPCSRRAAHQPPQHRQPAEAPPCPPTPPTPPAVGAQSTNPRNTVSQLKRLLGKKFSDPAVQADLQYFPYKVVEGPGGECLFQVGGWERWERCLVLVGVVSGGGAQLGECLLEAGRGLGAQLSYWTGLEFQCSSWPPSGTRHVLFQVTGGTWNSPPSLPSRRTVP